MILSTVRRNVSASPRLAAARPSSSSAARLFRLSLQDLLHQPLILGGAVLVAQSFNFFSQRKSGNQILRIQLDRFAQGCDCFWRAASTFLKQPD